MNGDLPAISVVEPLAPAFERMKLMLFHPFNIEKWLTIGFCAWLATLGKAAGGGVNTSTPRNIPSDPDKLHQLFQTAKSWILDNLQWVVPAMAAILALGIVLWLIVAWLSSRGRFLFLHCVAENRAEVRIPWTQYAAHGDSLFLFRVFLGVAACLAVVPLLIACAWVTRPMLSSQNVHTLGLSASLILGLLAILAGATFLVIAKFTSDFVVPIMYLRTSRCLNAWRELAPLLSAHAAPMILYVLFQIVLKVAIGLGVLLVVVLTCCVAGCFLAIPYIGTVLLLPILIFERAYSLLYLAQFGTAYNVFSRALPAPPSPGHSPQF